MQLGSAQNQLSFQQGSAIYNSQFDQKIEGKRFSLLNADKSLSCSPVKNLKKKDKKEDKIELGYANENTLNAICSNLKLFYELEIEQSTINFNQQIMNLKSALQKKDVQENNLIAEVKRIQSKHDQLQLEHEMIVKDLNHKYKYQMQLFKCQVEQQINEYSSQIVDVASKNAELLDILSADYGVCQKYKSLFKDYKNGQAYQELMTKNISITNEIRIMKLDQQILQQDNSNYIQQLTKLTKKVNLFQKLNEQRQQEILEKDQIISLYEKQNQQMQIQYQLMMQEFSSNVLSLLKSKDILQDEIALKLQKELNEIDRQRKELLKNESNMETKIQELNQSINEQNHIKLQLSQKINQYEMRIKHLIESHCLELETMRNDTGKLLKLQEKNNLSKNEQHNQNMLNQKQFYEKQLTDWKNNYYKVSQKLCELEQNITNGPKYYLQKAYEDYQQNVQRTIEASDNKIQELIQQNLKLQNSLNLLNNENQIYKEQIIEFKDQCQNYISTLHNAQKEQLQSQEKMQQINLVYEENNRELQEIRQRLQKELEQKTITESDQQESQSKLEQQVQNLKREIISLTQQAKPVNQSIQFNNLNNPSLKVEKIPTSTTNKFINNSSIYNQSQVMNTTVNQNNHNNSVFNTIGLELNNESAASEQIHIMQSTHKSPMQNKQIQQQQMFAAKSNMNYSNNGDTWQIQQFCFKMIGDFQTKFEQTMTTIKDNMDKQYHNALFKEVRLSIEKDSRVLDLPFEEKKQFTLKATDYFGLIIQGKMKDVKIDILIHEIATLMKIELKEKVNLQIQLEKALKENISLQKASQNRIGHESEEFRNILQNQINKLFQNLKDLDTQKLQQIEIRQIEQTIKKDLMVQFEIKLNMELEESKRFIEGMREEYNNLMKLHEQQVRDITINLGSEISFLQSQLQKKITQAALTFNSIGSIEEGNYHLFPQTQVLHSDASPKQRLMSQTTTQNFQKSSSCSFNKENFSKDIPHENRNNTITQTMQVMNQSIPYQIVVQTINSQDNISSNQKKQQSQRIGSRQLTVSQHLSTTGEISTIPSSKQGNNFLKKIHQSSSVENGLDVSSSTSSANSKLNEIFAFSKPSLSHSLDVNKEMQQPSSNKSDVFNKRSNRTKYLNQSIDVLEGIREEKQNKLKNFLNEDILDMTSQKNNLSFNDSELRRTYQHFVLPSKSVEPGVNRTTQNGVLGNKKNVLNSTISVLKDIQSSVKSNGKRLYLGQRNTIQGQSPSIQLQNSNQKAQNWQNLKHFNQQNNQSRQKMKLSQLALITNEAINIQLQSSTSNQTYNNPLLSSLSKDQQ